nr:immunoglobulin heavy chain junction region [Macaca mulatta]
CVRYGSMTAAEATYYFDYW